MLWGNRLIRSRWVKMSLVLGMTVFLASATFDRNKDYHDEMGFYKGIILERPENPRAYMFLGNAYRRSGNYETALKHLKKSIQILSRMWNLSISGKKPNLIFR